LGFDGREGVVACHHVVRREPRRAVRLHLAGAVPAAADSDAGLARLALAVKVYRDGPNGQRFGLLCGLDQHGPIQHRHATLPSRLPPCGFSRAGTSSRCCRPATDRARSRTIARRSLRVVPAHTPNGSQPNANARHSAFTGQGAQMLRAVFTPDPVSGKNNSESTPAHAALSRHSLSCGLTVPPLRPPSRTVRPRQRPSGPARGSGTRSETPPVGLFRVGRGPVTHRPTPMLHGRLGRRLRSPDGPTAPTPGTDPAPTRPGGSVLPAKRGPDSGPGSS